MLERIAQDRPFVLIESKGHLDLYQGEVHALDQLADIHKLARHDNTDVVFVLPYHVIRERGFEATGDEPVIGLSVDYHYRGRTRDVLSELPDFTIKVTGDITSSLSDEEYAALVARFQENEIERGQVSQTTLSRTFHGRIENPSIAALLGAFRRIIEQAGHYMAVLYVNPAENHHIIAATPERHLEVTGTQTIMTPIAGTLRKEDRETFSQRLEAFLQDGKEINELFQVLDEEMKIMGLICPEGGIIDGPFLREVGAVVHTEYNLLGKRTLHSIDALRETLHAPTVVGSPMESAARVIARYEPESRRYYAGEIGIYGRPRSDAPDGDIDSAILIRMAEVFHDGSFVVQAGGGLVRDSDPANEARESWAKAQGILGCLLGSSDPLPYLTPELTEQSAEPLRNRNRHLSPFWMDDQDAHPHTDADLRGKRVTIIDNEDNFACMIAHVVRSFDVEVNVMDTFEFDVTSHGADAVIIGPGPGDPNDATHPRMKKLREIVSQLYGSKVPLLGICLGHQVLSLHLGLQVEQQSSSTQGMPRTVQIGGTAHELGFYNSFSPVDSSAPSDIAMDIDDRGRVIAMRGENFVGFQFHPESVMSKTGLSLLHEALSELVR